MEKKNDEKSLMINVEGDEKISHQSYVDTITAVRENSRKRRKIIAKIRIVRRVLAFVLTFGFFAMLVFYGFKNGNLIIEHNEDNNLSVKLAATTLSSSKRVISRDEYESEYEQFMYELDSETIVDIPELEQFENYIPQEYQPEVIIEPERESVVLSTSAVDSDAPIIEDSTIEDANDNKSLFPTILINSVPVCNLQSSEDAKWIRSALLDKYTKPVAGGKMTRRGFLEEFEILYNVEQPDQLMDKSEAYLMLQDKVSVRLREEIEVVQTVPYKTVYKDDATIDKGKTKVETEGKDGKATGIFEVVSINGVEKERNQKGEAKLLEESVSKVIIRGTRELPKATERPSVSSSSSSSKNSAVSSNDKISAYNGSKATYGSQRPGNYSTIEMPSSSYAFSGSKVGSGKYYPNIDTTLKRPGKDQGIVGPSPGSLNFGYSVKGKGRGDVTSYFGWRFGRMHYGNDTFAPTGTAIVASESGIVTSYTGTHSGYGLVVEIKHVDGFTTRYAHCDSIDVKVGQGVSKGEHIATVGSTGTTDSSPHLHFEIRHNGVPYNPLFYM